MKAVMIVAVLVFLVLICGAGAQVARKENVKYLRCPVCEEISGQLYSQVLEKQEHKKKITEVEVIELVEKICDIKKKESEWMFFLDIVHEGKRLKLFQQPEEGECNTRCKTIQRTCQEVIGDHDVDIGEFIYTHINKLSAAEISKVLCKDLSKSCSSKQPVVPKDLDLGEPFMPKSSKDADMSRLMRSMGEIPGAPGMKMYSKDDLMNMKNFGNQDDDDEDDDDEEPDNKFKSLLSKKANNLKAEILKKQSFRTSISTVAKQVTESIRSFSQTTARNARKTFNKATKLIRRWQRRRSSRQNKKSDL